MFKVSSSLLLSALVLGAMAFRPSGACPYLAAQDRQSGPEADVVAGTAPHPMVRKLQAEELSNKAEVPEIQAEELGNKEESPVSLNHHVDRQLFFIFDWFQAILDFFFGFFSNGGAGDSSSDDNGGRGGGDNGGNDGGGDDGDGDGNQGGGGDFDDTPFQGSVQESLTAARQDIIGIMDAPKVRSFHSPLFFMRSSVRLYLSLSNFFPTKVCQTCFSFVCWRVRLKRRLTTIVCFWCLIDSLTPFYHVEC